MASIEPESSCEPAVDRSTCDVDVLGADRGQSVFEMQARIERQRAGINLLAAQIGPLLDLVGDCSP